MQKIEKRAIKQTKKPSRLNKQKEMNTIDLPTYDSALITGKSFTVGEMKLPFSFFGTWEDPLIDPQEAAAILDIKNIYENLRTFSHEQKINLSLNDMNGRSRPKVFLRIKGLYRLIGKSRKPYAIEFQEWVYDILEEIRINGRYELEKALIKIEKQQELHVQSLAIKEAELAVLKRTREKDERVKKREKERESARNAAGQHLYIYLDDRKYHKVGMTEQTVNKRLRDQKTSLPDLILLATYNVVRCRLIESVVHFILEPYRVSPKPEFFDIDLSYIKGVIERTILFVEGYRFNVNADSPMTTSQDISKLISELHLSSMQENQTHINKNIPEEQGDEEEPQSQSDIQKENHRSKIQEGYDAQESESGKEQVNENFSGKSFIHLPPLMKRKISIDIVKENDIISKIIEFMKLDMSKNGIEYNVNEIRPVKMQELFNHLRSYGFVSIPAAEKLNEALICLNVQLKRHKFCNKCQIVVKKYKIKCCPSFHHNDRSNTSFAFGISKLTPNGEY